MRAARIAASALMALTVGACATEQGPAPPTPLPQSDMTGRWVLSAPNAPPCGMELGGAPGQVDGPIVPEGGCPGKFFTSKRWTFAQDTLTLTIADRDNVPLAQFALGDGRFTGKSTAGLPVALSR
jgi:protease inhibitor Inh